MKLIFIPKENLYADSNFIPKLEYLLSEVLQRSYDFTEDLNEIETLNTDLTENPEEGIVEFNIAYAKVQNDFNYVSDIHGKVLREIAIWQNFLSQANALYRRERNKILVKDKIIQALRNQSLQEAAVQEQLKEISDLKEQLENVVKDLKNISLIIENKKDKLDKAAVAFNRQQRNVETLIGLNYPVKAKRVEE